MLPPLWVATYQMPISTTMPSSRWQDGAAEGAQSFAESANRFGLQRRVAVFSIFFSLTGSATTSAPGWLFMLPPKGTSFMLPTGTVSLWEGARSTGFSRPKSPLIVNALMILSLALRP